MYYMITFIVVAMVRRIWFLRVHPKTNWCHEVGLVLFFVYLVAIVDITGASFASVLDLTVKGSINMVPFREIKGMLNSASPHSLLNVWGNVAMFIPMGVGIPLLWKRGFTTIILCFLASCTIEFFQLFSYRSTDVDDIILNTLGGILGYLLFLLLRWILPKVTNDFRRQI